MKLNSQASNLSEYQKNLSSLISCLSNTLAIFNFWSSVDRAVFINSLQAGMNHSKATWSLGSLAIILLLARTI